MKRIAAVALLAVVLLPGAAFAGSSTDAALGLGAFAVFNQILGGVGIFGAPVVVAPAPVVYAPPPVVYAPPPPPVYVAPRPVYVVPGPVYVAPRPVYARSWRGHPHRHGGWDGHGRWDDHGRWDRRR